MSIEERMKITELLKQIWIYLECSTETWRKAREFFKKYVCIPWLLLFHMFLALILERISVFFPVAVIQMSQCRQTPCHVEFSLAERCPQTNNNSSRSGTAMFLHHLLHNEHFTVYLQPFTVKPN